MAAIDTLEELQEFAERIEWEAKGLPDLGALAYVANNKGYWAEAENIQEFQDKLKRHITAEFCEHPEEYRWYHGDSVDNLSSDYYCDSCGAHSREDDGEF